MGKPAAVQPGQLGEDEHSASSEPGHPLDDSELSRRSALRERDVANLIKSGLPPQLQSLAAPAAGALRNAAVQGGGKGAAGVNQGAVTLNLALIVDDIASR